MCGDSLNGLAPSYARAVVVAPVNAGSATRANMEYVSDNAILQGLYAVPGFLGFTVLQVGQATLRIIGGALEVLPGLALFAFETDLSEDFNLFRQGTLMGDFENPLGENPPWLAYVLPLTPITIDARVGPMCPWARYDDPADDSQSGYATR